MTKMRESTGAVIGILVFAFGGLWVLQDSGAFDAVGRGGTGQTIATVDGVDVDAELFNRAVEQQLNVYRQQGIDITPAIQAQVENQVYDALIDNAIVEREMDRLGIEVTDDEVFELITGPTPDPLIAQVFPDGQGGVDRNALTQVVNDPQYAEQLSAIEEQVRRNRRQAKLAALIGATARVTEAELQAEFVRRNRTADAQFVALRYADVPDSEVEVSDRDLQAYFREHRKDYERERAYGIEYVAFSKSPTRADSARALTELNGLKAGLASASDPAAYARTHSFGAETAAATAPAGTLAPEFATALYSNLAPGRVVGPVIAGDQAYLARITGVTAGEGEAIRARHILVADAQEALARQIKEQIQSGQTTFVQAARQLSIDESNKAQGGDLGWFGRGRMVAEFEQAAFAAPTGTVIGPVKTQFGWHLIQVEGRTNQVAEIVQITRPVEGDFDRIREKAEDFQVFLTEEKRSFEASATEAGLTPTAITVGEDQGYVPGLDVGRELFRFLRKASVGDVSEPFDAGDKFIVARVTDVTDAGVAPFDEVRDQVEAAVLLDKKKAVQLERLRAAAQSDGSLQSVATASGATIQTATDLSLATPMLTGYGREPQAIGAVFGLRPGQRSRVVEGGNAAFVVQTSALRGGLPAEMTEEAKTQLRQEILNRKRSQILQSWIRGLRDDADVEDLRSTVL